MSDLIIAAFASQNAAFVAGESLTALQSAAGTEPEDIVVVTREASGRVSVHQSLNLATGTPLGDGRWGALIGLMFLDRRPTSATGLAAQLRATGLDGDFLRDAAQMPDRGGAAVGLRVRLLGVDRVRETLARSTGRPRVLHARLSASVEDALHDLQGQIPQQALGQAASDGAP